MARRCRAPTAAPAPEPAACTHSAGLYPAPASLAGRPFAPNRLPSRKRGSSPRRRGPSPDRRSPAGPSGDGPPPSERPSVTPDSIRGPSPALPAGADGSVSSRTAAAGATGQGWTPDRVRGDGVYRGADVCLSSSRFNTADCRSDFFTRSFAGVTPAFAREGGGRQARQRHRTEMCASGRGTRRGGTGYVGRSTSAPALLKISI